MRTIRMGICSLLLLLLLPGMLYAKEPLAEDNIFSVDGAKLTGAYGEAIPIDVMLPTALSAQEPMLWLLQGDEEEEQIQEVQWEQQDDMWRTSYTAAMAGSYRLKVVTSSQEAYVSAWFCLDTQAPSYTFLYQGKPVTAETIFYEPKLTIQVQEPHFVEQASYLYIQEEAYAVDWQQQEAALWMAEVALPDIEGSICLGVHLEDQVGHVQDEITAIWIESDFSAPQIMVYADDEQITQGGFYQKPVQLRVEVADPHLRKESVQVSINDEMLSLQEQEGVLQTMKTLIEGSYTIQVAAEDEGGHYRQVKITDMVIDHTAPLVQVMTNKRQQYEKEPIWWKIKIKEAYLDQTNSHITIQKDGAFYASLPLSYDEESGMYTASGHYAEDGAYELSLQIYDLAGNTAVYTYNGQPWEEAIYRFTIDQQAPFVSASVSSSLSKEAVSLRISVEDKHLRSYQIHVLRDHEEIWEDWQQGTTSGSWTYEIVGPSQQHGVYEVYVEAVDQAGNRACSDVQQFVIDRKPYETKLLLNGKEVQNGGVYHTNQPVRFTLSWYDELPQQEQLLLYEDGKKQELSLSTDHYTWEQDTVSDKQKEYRFVLQLYDRAGNQTSCEFTIYQQKKTLAAQLVNDVFNGKPYADSWTPQLAQGKDTQIIDYVLRRNQKEIAYTWGEPITEDGDYELQVLLQDEASNHSKLQPFTFTIDQTPPLLQLLDTQGKPLQDGAVIRGGRLTLSIYQEDPQKQQEEILSALWINDERISLPKDAARYVLQAKAGTLSIRAEAKDLAGNRTMLTWNLQVEGEDTSWIGWFLLLSGIGAGVIWGIYRYATYRHARIHHPTV